MRPKHSYYNLLVMTAASAAGIVIVMGFEYYIRHKPLSELVIFGVVFFIPISIGMYIKYRPDETSS